MDLQKITGNLMGLHKITISPPRGARKLNCMQKCCVYNLFWGAVGHRKSTKIRKCVEL